MTKVTVLSLKDAIAAGYIWAIEDGDEQGFKITTLSLEELEVYKKRQPDTIFWLCDKEDKHFSISEETLHELIQDYITNQDEFADEDGALNDYEDEVFEEQKSLYTQLCAAINESLKKEPFIMPSNFQVDFTL